MRRLLAALGLALGLGALPAACSFTPATCSDGLRNGAETDVDCGGTCAPCATGKGCAVAADCTSLRCASGSCTAPTCTDGVQNGGESDVDCGGTTGCSRCGNGKRCATNTDCAMGACIGATCTAASCTDGQKNGAETDVDCGGGSVSMCAPCKDGQACVVGGDCASGSCMGKRCAAPGCAGLSPACGVASNCPCNDGQTCAVAADCQSHVCRKPTTGVMQQCAAPTCMDGVENGAETSIDCGGPMCTPCAPGLGCTTGSDCTSKVCHGGLCQVPSCSDMAQNEGETDVDCGGPCGATCSTGQMCAGKTDCVSGVCSGGACAKPTCTDGMQNGGETDVDCGGPCVLKCAPGQHCLVAGDCASSVCDNDVCASPSCSDGVKNGGETDVDCGGPCATKCQGGKGCLTAADCQSNQCPMGSSICVPTSCTDGVQDGNETDVDCGGSCMPCDNGKKCATLGDCTSAACNAGTCGPWSIALDVADSFDLTTLDHAITWAPGGDLIVAGSFSAAISFGNGTSTLSPGAGFNAFLAKLSPNGIATWAHTLATAGQPFVTSVRTDTMGNIFVGGFARGVNLGGGFIPSGGPANAALVAKYDASGTLAWANLFGGTQPDVVNALAVDGNGDVVLVGYFTSPSITFGGPPLANGTGGAQQWAYVAKLSGADGSCKWSFPYGDPSGTSGAFGVAVDAANDVLVTGKYAPTIDLDGGLLETGQGVQGGFLLKLQGATGTSVWSRNLTGTGNMMGTSVAVDPSGDVVVAGQSLAPQADFGTGSQVSCGFPAAFAAKYRGADGAYRWASCFADGSPNDFPSIDVSPAGDAYLAGRFASLSIKFGGASLTFMNAQMGTHDVFVAQLAGLDGSVLAAQTYGSTGDDFAQGIAVNRMSGDAALIGAFENNITFGSAQQLSRGASPDGVFIASLGASP